jgi:prepilin-type processing-associated H-X9-DG protein
VWDYYECDLGFQWDGSSTTAPVTTSGGSTPFRIDTQLVNLLSTPTPPNGSVGSNLNSVISMPPSSRHGGGVVVSYCDGHQDFLRDDISFNTFEHLMTPDSSMSGIPGTFDPASIGGG